MVKLCKVELLRCGESLEIRQLGIGDCQQTYEDKSYQRCGLERTIAASVIQEIRQRMEAWCMTSENSSDEAVSSIAMKIMKEEEKTIWAG